MVALRDRRRPVAQNCCNAQKLYAGFGRTCGEGHLSALPTLGEVTSCAARPDHAGAENFLIVAETSAFIRGLLSSERTVDRT
jgi:hypothetical protein